MDYQDQEKIKAAAESERELVRLWRAWRTVHEMCFDRGYELSEEELRISLDDFRDKFADTNGAPNRARMNTQFKPTTTMLDKYTPLPSKADPSPTSQIGTILIDFAAEANIGVKQFRAFAHHIGANNFKSGIYITQSSITPAALKIIPAALQNGMFLETFQESDLLVNITHHELVPKHVLLSSEEKKRLLERYRLKESQLPRIQTGDPVAKYLGLRRGQVVKIIRKSETAGRYASYRWAI